MKINKKTFLIVVYFLIAVFLFANTGFRTLLRRYWEISKLTSELGQLKKENILLRDEIYYLQKDDSYIEKMARRELGVIDPQEIEYRFKK
jgi:cell division protein FtsB